MTLITIALIIILIGVLMWFVNAKIPMEETLKTILNVVVAIAVILWVLAAGFGVNIPIVSPAIR